MTAIVRVAPLLRQHVDGRSRLTDVEGATVGEVLANAYLFDHCTLDSEAGLALHPHVKVFVDDEDAAFIGGLDATVPEGSEVSILVAAAGG